MYTTAIEVPDGAVHMGYFFIPNGQGRNSANSDYADGAEVTFMEDTNNSNILTAYIDGNAIAGQYHPVYFSDARLNPSGTAPQNHPGGYDHELDSLNVEGNSNWEDLPNKIGITDQEAL